VIRERGKKKREKRVASLRSGGVGVFSKRITSTIWERKKRTRSTGARGGGHLMNEKHFTAITSRQMFGSRTLRPKRLKKEKMAIS